MILPESKLQMRDTEPMAPLTHTLHVTVGFHCASMADVHKCFQVLMSLWIFQTEDDVASIFQIQHPIDNRLPKIPWLKIRVT